MLGCTEELSRLFILICGTGLLVGRSVKTWGVLGKDPLHTVRLPTGMLALLKLAVHQRPDKEIDMGSIDL